MKPEESPPRGRLHRLDVVHPHHEMRYSGGDQTHPPLSVYQSGAFKHLR
jgi:hypothetical protein